MNATGTQRPAISFGPEFPRLWVRVPVERAVLNRRHLVVAMALVAPGARLQPQREPPQRHPAPGRNLDLDAVVFAEKFHDLNPACCVIL